jgi:6-phosphogluconolactonase (cycloisomerase 2 family)
MENNLGARAALLIALAAATLYTLGCGVSTGAPAATPLNTYLYVGAPFAPPNNPMPLTGSVTQYRVEGDGTLTTLNTSSTGDVVPYIELAVTPANQYLFMPSDGISEFEIGNDGTLAAAAAPTATGTSIAFAQGGKYAFIADLVNNTLNSYSVSASGVLTPISSVTTTGYSEYVAVDGSGKFLYVSDGRGAILEYTASASGVLAANGSVLTGGDNSSALVVSPGGFLYCLNSEPNGAVYEFSIDASTGALTLVNSYAIVGGSSWISFDPAGTHAYLGNLAYIEQFTVDETTGALIANGTTTNSSAVRRGGVDPSGRFLFTAGVAPAPGGAEGMVQQFIISSAGTLIPNGSLSLGFNFVGTTLTFAQR